ncbi:MAG: UxaA family hydrolase [Chloroflexota bacterium]
MSVSYQLHDIGRLPLLGDNVAIATRNLDAGTTIVDRERSFMLDYTVMEGHRFAISPIAKGEALLSWELPFGRATVDIAPGNYVCNEGMLTALSGRTIDFALPPSHNFIDEIRPYDLNADGFQMVDQLPLYDNPRTFKGYRRSENRGVGTRNFIMLMGMTSRTGGYVKQLEARLKGISDAYENIDGIVALAHTEGDVENPNNLHLTLRTLAGFAIHPNIGAVLIVDYGFEPVTNQMLEAYLTEQDYPLSEVPHQFLSLSGSFETNLQQGETIVKGWLDEVNDTPRTDESLADLNLVLQCGGSDAFSGISGNPLASWVAREIIRSGGKANLAETDELIGAESYVLQKVSNLETAERFLKTIERFKEWASWHGHSAEGNPSGGNKFRGLYNIVLKSIGAAMKRHPDVRLDYVIDYAERMMNPGYYFMDSPGNDLESIAGQVAAGGNIIYFVTGNGSITNFPFVPTIKIVTTSARFELLSKDMDVNAGAYLDGMPMDDLGQQTLDLTINVASGQKSVGEAAGHTQAQLWRNWEQTSADNITDILATPTPLGESIPVQDIENLSDLSLEVFETTRGHATDQIGLVLPTSLCSGQIARMAANHLNDKGIGQDQGLSRYVSLVHTEGCGAASGQSEAFYVRTMLGYLTHPLVKYCLLLEHGCEKTHNDHMLHEIEQLGIDPKSLGWASIQLDGGIEKVMDKIEDWFSTQLTQGHPNKITKVGLDGLRVGMVSAGPVSDSATKALSDVARMITSAGGTVVMPSNTSILDNGLFASETFVEPTVQPTLAYAQRAEIPGLHIMEMPSQHWVETLVGLGATGVEVMLAYIGEHPMQAHPLVPVVQVTADEGVQVRYGADLDLVFDGQGELGTLSLLTLLADVVSRRKQPKLYQQGNVDFQITRGLLGISL